MTKWPQHVTPELATNRARAPYNFVPLPERLFLPEEERTLPEEERTPFKENDTLAAKRSHGWIDLEIVTETPTYTRCAYPPEEEEKDVLSSPPRQEHYHHGDPACPVLPGSSLRGMVRSLVEILSYARLSRRDEDGGGATRLFDKRLVHRFVADQQTPAGRAYQDQFVRRRGGNAIDYPGPNVLAGYLEQDGGTFGIRPARLHQGVGFVRVSLGDVQQAGISAGDWHVIDPVFVAPAAPALHKSERVDLHYARTASISRKPAKGLERGVLVCSGPMKSKRMHTVVYAPDPAKPVLPIPTDIWEDFQEDREMHRGIACRKVQPGDPCFYLVDGQGQLVFLGPALFFRIPYGRRTSDFVPEALMGGEGLDLAEALFGTVNPFERSDARPEGGAHRGRVSFDDARMTGAPGSNPFLEGRKDGRRTPAILSAPKPTSYQHYLVQTETSGDGRAVRARLKSYWSKSPEQTVLRGHKLYWHRGSPPSGELSEQLPDPTNTQQTVIRPVRPGVTFAGKVRFENLTELELGALLWALDLPEDCRHHLGMGKPYGLGSIRVSPRLHLRDPRARYASLTATGERGEADTEAVARAAREVFSRVILAHHNSAVRAPKIAPDASLWEIPRLAALRILLRWQGHPRRDETVYMPLDDFRPRPVLPTPAALARKADPNVDADVPEGSARPVAALAAARPPVVSASRAGRAGPPPGARRKCRGRIAYFSQGGVGVQLDGEPRARKVAVRTDIFPLEAWKKLNGNELRRGRSIEVELDGEQVTRVVPASG